MDLLVPGAILMCHPLIPFYITHLYVVLLAQNPISDCSLLFIVSKLMQ